MAAQQQETTRVVSDGGTGCVIDPNAKRPTKVSGGILNAKATLLPVPNAVRNTSGRKLRGKVSVQVLVGEDGEVLSATGVSGNEILRHAAEAAALLARFKPTLLDGSPVNVSGLLEYRF